MTNEAITRAIKSVLGEYASPEKIAALDAALRPIYGQEAALISMSAASLAKVLGDGSAWSACNAVSKRISDDFGVTDNG